MPRRVELLTTTLCLAWLACTSSAPSQPEPEPECTEGVDCAVDPVCGDGAIAGDESCDDGNPWGGDGCRPDCSSEDGLLESEPNDDPLEPQDPAGAATIHGALPSGDRDCYAVSVDEAGFVSAAVVPDDGDSCGAEMVLELYDSEGVRIASGLPGRNGCAALDASQDTWLHYLVAGDYAVCVGVIFESVVPA